MLICNKQCELTAVCRLFLFFMLIFCLSPSAVRPSIDLHAPHSFIYGVYVCVFVSSPRTLTSIEDSDVYRMLQKNEDEEPLEPRQSGSFKALQDFVESDGQHCLCIVYQRDNPRFYKNASERF